jgi:hypothetical protein
MPYLSTVSGYYGFHENCLDETDGSLYIYNSYDDLSTFWNPSHHCTRIVS